MLDSLDWLSLDNPYFALLAEKHRSWLRNFALRHLKDWETGLRNDFETALFEAAVRDHMERLQFAVRPNKPECAATRSPDFICTKGASSIYVEATCIKAEAARHNSGINDSEAVSPLNPYGFCKSVFRKCTGEKGKAEQCDTCDASALVVTGTFDPMVSLLWDRFQVQMVLTGEPSFSWSINPQTAKLGPLSPVTKLDSATFLRGPRRNEETGHPIFDRKSISAVLVYRGENTPCLGVHNPCPNYPLDQSLFAGIEFAKLTVDQLAKRLEVNWSID